MIVPRVALAAVAASMLLTGCSAGRPDVPNSPATTPAAQTPTEEAPESCIAVQSAVRYAEQLMVTYGQESRQNYEGALRGRISYVVGTIERVHDDLPGAARDEADRVHQLGIKAASVAAIRDPDRASLLYRYRTATRRFHVACGLAPE